MKLDTPDQRIVLEIRLSDWDPNETGVVLKGYQAVFDPAGYTSGLAGTLTPFRTPCTSSAQCASAIGGGGTCGEPGIPPNTCPAGFILASRPEFVFRAIPNLIGVDQSTPSYRWGGAVQGDSIQNLKCVGGLEPGKVCLVDGDCPGFPSVLPDGTCEINHADRYGGTFVLDVPADARGTFTLSLKPVPDSVFLDDDNEPIVPQTTEIALITIKCQSALDCNDDNLCTTDNCNGGGTCSNTPNYDPLTHCCDPDTGISTIIDDDNECTKDVCDPDTGLVTHPPEDAGTTCGDANSSECDAADSCDGAGNCDPNFVAADTPCGSAANTDCTDPDTCDGAGTCQFNHVADATPCEDGLFCTSGDLCNNGVCVVGGDPCTPPSLCSEALDACVECLIDADCDDAIPCTTDICNGIGACENNLNAGSCLIAGTCYADGALNPANDCQECDPGSDPLGWSFLPDGTLCDDGDPCTGTGRPGIGFDECDGAGTCSGIPDPQCNNTCDFAIPAAEGVTPSIIPDGGPGDVDDAEASCTEDSNNDIWFEYTASCTGMVFMSTTGSTLSPSNDPVLSVLDDCPFNGGVEIACDDDSGAELQAALMLNVVGGTNYLIRMAGFENNTGSVVLNISTVDDCLIDDGNGPVCYEAGDLNPDNDCLACVPEVSTTGWTPLAEGSACGAPGQVATECDDPDACDGAGLCEVNYKPDGTACSDDGIQCTFDQCGTGLCTHPPRPLNTPCGDPIDHECDGPDICDGASLCIPNNKPFGTVCGDQTVTECDLADRCDGNGSCDINYAANGTGCDDLNVCTGTDICTDGLCAGTSILQAPQVVQEGCRFIKVTPKPPGSPAPVALHLTSPNWACVNKYIGAAGNLVNSPVFLTPDAWGTLLVGGVVQIAPSSRYDVVAECGAFVSTVGFATTAKYGDIVGIFVGGVWTPPNGIIDSLDFTAIIEAFQGEFTAPPKTRTDIFPCTPDGIIDILDMVWVVNSFQGEPYPCAKPCP